MSIDKEFSKENENQLFLQMLFNHLFCDAQNLWKTCQYFIANVWSYGECYYFKLSCLIRELNSTLSDCYSKLIFTFYSNLFQLHFLVQISQCFMYLSEGNSKQLRMDAIDVGRYFVYTYIYI